MPRLRASNAAAADLRKYRRPEALNKRTSVFMTCPFLELVVFRSRRDEARPGQPKRSLERVIVVPLFSRADVRTRPFGVSSPTPSNAPAPCHTIAIEWHSPFFADEGPRSACGLTWLRPQPSSPQGSHHEALMLICELRYQLAVERATCKRGCR